MKRALALAAALGLAGCPSSETITRGEGLDEAKLPADVRADYEVYAQRCSKCHSLARSLESGITDDDFWKQYVARMRRQPGSGITAQDEVVILRFLHYYSEQQRKKKEGGG